MNSAFIPFFLLLLFCFVLLIDVYSIYLSADVAFFMYIVLLLKQVASPFPPSDKIGIKSVQRETEEIIPMKQMKFDWVPYIPLEKRYIWFRSFLDTSVYHRLLFHCSQLLTLTSFSTGKLKLKD